jgi:hypothetical protein
MTFRQKITRLTDTANKAAVCRSAGLGENFLYNLSRRTQPPTMASVKKLAAALRVDAYWLFNDDLDWPPVHVDRLPEPTKNLAGATV